jgi:EmrB/QacA subfamily drug resistance transporter
MPVPADPAPEKSAPPPSPASFFLTVFPSIVLPMFLAVVDQTIVATALPAMAASLGNVDRVSWVVVSYLIASTVAAPVYGQLGDVFGRRRLMFVALGVFIAASTLCALARSMDMLIGARVLQGLGGGGLMTLSQALIGEAIPPRQRGRYQGYLAGVAVASNAFGPVAGGYLTEHFGWEWVFYINLPIGLLAVLLTFRLQAVPGGQKWWRFDTPGLILFIMFVAPTLLALERLQQFDARAAWSTSIWAGVGLISLILLLKFERRSSSPLLPITLLRQPAIWRSDALAACHGACLVSLITFIPIYLQVVRGTSPSETGVLMLPLTFGIGIGSMLTGRLVTMTGRTTILPSFGLSFAVVILVAMALLAARLTVTELGGIFLLIGLCLGTTMAVVQVTVQDASGPSMLGAGAASVQYSRSVGAAFGTATVAAVLFTVLSMMDPQTAAMFRSLVEQGAGAIAGVEPGRRAIMQADIAAAFRAGFLTIAGFAALGLICALSIPTKRI